MSWSFHQTADPILYSQLKGGRRDGVVHWLMMRVAKNIFLFVTYTIIQSITSSEICALHLTHPSAHTPGAVGSQRCGAWGAVGGSVPCSRVSSQSWTIPAGAKI